MHGSLGSQRPPFILNCLCFLLALDDIFLEILGLLMYQFIIHSVRQKLLPQNFGDNPLLLVFFLVCVCSRINTLMIPCVLLLLRESWLHMPGRSLEGLLSVLKDLSDFTIPEM